MAWRHAPGFAVAAWLQIASGPALAKPAKRLKSATDPVTRPIAGTTNRASTPTTRPASAGHGSRRSRTAHPTAPPIAPSATPIAPSARRTGPFATPIAPPATRAGSFAIPTAILTTPPPAPAPARSRPRTADETLDRLREPAAPPARPLYPRALTRRKLFLPAGVFEGRLGIEMARTEPAGAGGGDAVLATSLRPNARLAVGDVELEAGANVLVDVTGKATQDSDRLAVAFLAVRFAATRDFGIGLQLVGNGLMSDLRALTPRLVVAYKTRPSAGTALELSIAPGLAFTHFETAAFSERATAFVSTGQLRAQGQVTSAVAVELRGALHVRTQMSFQQSADDPARLGLLGPADTTLTHDVGLRLVGSLSHAVDLTAGVDLVTSTRSLPAVFAVGITVRKLP